MNQPKMSAGIAAVLFTLLFLFSVFSVPLSAAASEVPQTNAAGVWLYCVEEDCVIYEKNAESLLYPASTVKIMTGLLACEILSDRLDEPITITDKMLGTGAGYRCLKLEKGDILTVRDLLYGAICGNDYDACYVLAYLASGSTTAFLDAMNKRAAELGATETHYTNPTGVHDSAMFTTVRDTAKVSLAAAKNPLYLEISSAGKYTCTNGTRVNNRNSLVTASPYRDDRCKGLNTGMTDEGGYCLATVAGDGKYTYLCVVMNVPQENRQYTEALSLIKWAFDSFGEVELIHEGDEICSVDVKLSDEADVIPLYASSGFSGYFPKDILDSPDLTIRHTTTDSALNAPVKAGEVAGNLTVLYQGKIIASIPLVTKDAVAQSGFLGTMNSIRSLTGKRWFRAAVACAVILLCIYGTIFYLLYRKKQNHRKKQLAGYAKYVSTPFHFPSSPLANKRPAKYSSGKNSSNSGSVRKQTGIPRSTATGKTSPRYTSGTPHAKIPPKASPNKSAQAPYTRSANTTTPHPTKDPEREIQKNSRR